MTATSTGMYIYAELPENNNPMLYRLDTKVRCSDGQTINTIISEGGNPYDPEVGYNISNAYGGTYIFAGWNSSGEFEYTPLDPKNIVSVTIDGVTIDTTK